MAAWENSCDLKPLITALREGRASTDLQRWIADCLERGSFKARKSLAERYDAQEDLILASKDVESIKRLFAGVARNKNINERALELAALRRRVSLFKLGNYEKRGPKDRRRL